MEAPFGDVDEYLIWRTISAEAQAMGMNSQMMESMANKAETAAMAVGFGPANALKAAARPGIQAAGRNTGKWLRMMASFVQSLRKPVANLAQAAKDGKLWVGFVEGKGVVTAYGKQIGKVEVTTGGRLRIELDSKYATLENTQTVLAALPKAGIGKVAYVFAGKAEADAFESFMKSNTRAITPATNFREAPAQVEVFGITYSGPGGKGLEHHVIVDVGQF